ncbi:MAG: TlyA family RNA methyltransferase [Eubacteriaceae bacterium]|jgi:23S rRNA (cytidine1920-2'-O)/16S rRNA (cytidine1409-2'-O)-methyltransferase|nr:TlyA family RNA methyltransferase [Eubacteriaceae bacterium]
MKKISLENALIDRGLCESASQSRSFIMAGQVLVNGAKQDKAGFLVSASDSIEVKPLGLKYASRGGYKLEKALNSFNISAKGKHALDVGSSTGGFTDCLLQAGAAKVYAIDVGYGLLAYKLRSDERVAIFERENFRHFAFDRIGVKCEIAVMDVSFISAVALAANFREFIADGGDAVVLIKPQFEAKKNDVGANGIVRSASTHISALTRVSDGFFRNGLYLANIDYSPIKGSKGNIEFLAHFRKDKKSALLEGSAIDAIAAAVGQAHEVLT